MRVTDLNVSDEASLTDMVRVSARVTYADGDSEEYWFDVPEPKHAERLMSADGWLSALLPLAATLGEPLRIEGCVDGRLLDNARELLSIWSAWFPSLPGTTLEVARVGAAQQPKGGTGALFSGGADSFYTVLRARAGNELPITHLITIHGFDVPLTDADAFARLRVRHARAAQDLGCGLLPVATNLRTTRWREAAWETLAHGCGLAAAGHWVSGHIGRLLVPSGIGYWDLRPWGSHPLTDPLLSSSGLACIHDGAGARRFEKFETIASSPIARRALRVCWRAESDRNCGRCSKCLRAKVALDLLGALEQTETFRGPCPSEAELQRIYCAEPGHVQEIEDQIRRARKEGRVALARALERSLRGSAWRRRLLVAARRRTGPRATKSLEAALLKGWAR